MRKHWRGVTAAVLAVALLIGGYALTSGFAAEDSVPAVSYNLYISDYEDTNPDDGLSTMTMELYVYYNTNPTKYVDRGGFGLRFPADMDVAFSPNTDNIELYPLYSSTSGSNPDTELKEPGQHFFIWTVTPEVTRGGVYEDTVTETISLYGKDAETQVIPGGKRMHVGTYTMTLEDDFPVKNAIGQLDWMDTALSQDSMYLPDAEGIAINDEIWNDTDQDGFWYYQGHWQDKDLEMYQVDIPLLFTAPDYWPDTGITILSYDPTKKMELALVNEAGTVVADYEAPVWNATDKDTETVYAATTANAGTGTGPYFVVIQDLVAALGVGQNLDAGIYQLEVKKEGHLTQRLSLTLASGDLSQAEGLPQKDEHLYLPAGDINPVKDDAGATLYGDNRIDMADRAQLMHLLGKAAVAKTEDEPATYYADIDGDERVSQADLSILTSPQNYGKHTKEKEGY